MSVRYAARAAVSMIALAVLSSCGGGDSSSTPPVSAPAPAPTPSPTPAPTPTPPPTSSGSLASYSEGVVPLAANEDIFDLKATNAGLYFYVQTGNEERSHKIGKLHGAPNFSNAWSFVSPDDASDAHLWDYAPTNLLTEQDRAIAFEWSSSLTSNNGTVVKWGSYVANTGDISTTVVEPASIPGTFGFINTVAPGANTGIISSRSWIVEQRVGRYKVYQDDGGRTAANTVSDKFSTPATPNLSDSPTFALSHPSDPYLFLGVGQQVVKYDSRTMVSSWTFPGGYTDYATDGVFFEKDFYVAVGDKIYRLRSGGSEFQVVHTFSGSAALLPAGKFCIMNGIIFTADGEAVSTGVGTKKDFISSGTLSASQKADEAKLRGSLGGGVYCRHGNGRIYTRFVSPTAQRTILAITPL